MATVAISWGTVKSLLIFFAPVLLPRLITAYRSLRVSIASRPPPRPLPAAPARALNILFGGIVFFLLLSLPFNPHAPDSNIFSLTRSRLNTPTDVIFNRLARLRPNNLLTEADKLLQSKFISLGARKVYLTFGPDALVSCPYCSFDDLNTYLMYYLPFNVLLPHLVHLLLLGVATSAPIAGPESSRWRNKFTIGGLVLVAIDIYIVATYDAIQGAPLSVRAGQTPPSSLYNHITFLRPLAFVLYDVVCSVVLWLSATNRFFFKPPSPVDQVDQATSMAMQGVMSANSKLHAANVTRNAVVRDPTLKNRDDLYWRTMAASENPAQGSGEGGEQILNNIWEEEDVVRAISRAMAGQTGIDLAQLGVNANDHVREITEGLD
ncbi:uncharacterized protein N7515_002860 [Penicillium bovifimosum]|uniref:Uncharacterized protein n=1 Tax=Penicillium bovifimosum TaxID=126998 RepID=A0A9W9HCC2_9EURO|nr:uncharacterized protein N7515_002860 [Penicillium bovifimosum]KAJ5144073.1 hypothetical protein N7515_002860 [Penicillium bovifimosum]